MPQFIANIDEANQRVNALEAQLGITRSEFIDNTDAANARVRELESKIGCATTAAPQEKPKAPQPKPLPNDLAAIEKSGKVFGLGKAMIAAQRNHQQQEAQKAERK